MIYRLLKPAVTFATRQFFREIKIVGVAPVSHGPLLIVANHPNVMLDALLIIRAYPQSMRFIAKATIFRGSLISALLHALHFVPVKRRHDYADESVDNEDSFEYVAKCLADGASVLIFPEGASSTMRSLLPVKTGAARIAFRTEQEADFQAGLLIQPVGITYSDFYRLQSSVTLRFEKPIRVDSYQADWESDPRAAVKLLSDEIENGLRRATATVKTSGFANLVNKVSKLYQSRGEGEDDRMRIKAVAREVERLGPVYPEKAREIERRIDQYLHLSSALRLDGSKGLELEFNRFWLLLVSPFVVIGVLVHLIPYLLVARLVHRRSAHRSQLASWQISLAFVLFPLWYVLLGCLIGELTQSTAMGICGSLAAAGCGYFTNNYFHQLLLFSFSLFWPAKRSPVEVLREIRDDLLDELESLRGLKS